MSKMSKEVKISLLVVLAAGVSIFAPIVAQAITAPASGSFAYDIYDVAVNKILKGPVGFVGGVGTIVMGGISAVRGQVLPAVLATLGGGVILKADALTTSLGALV